MEKQTEKSLNELKNNLGLISQMMKLALDCQDKNEKMPTGQNPTEALRGFVELLKILSE